MIKAEWLTPEHNLEAVMDIRRRVFLEEQKLGEEYLTPDTNALIVLVRDGSVPCGTGRIMPYGESYLLGQIAVLPEYRGQKFGDLIVRMLIRKAYELGAAEQFVNAQPSAVGFYEKLNFSATGLKADTAIQMKHIGDVRGNCQ